MGIYRDLGRRVDRLRYMTSRGYEATKRSESGVTYRLTFCSFVGQLCQLTVIAPLSLRNVTFEIRDVNTF